MVGLGRLELPTSRLSGVRSNHLSYKPISNPTRHTEICAIITRLLDEIIQHFHDEELLGGMKQKTAYEIHR